VSDDKTARLRAVDDGPEPQRAAVRRAADATRVAIDKIVGSMAPVEVLEEVVARIEEATAALAKHPQHRAYAFAETSLAGDPSAFFDNSPIAGLANPLAPPVNLRIDGDKVVGDVEWNGAYEGPPGCCHGGHIAAAFDEVLGLAQDLAGQSGMTGTLTIRYRRPTPLNVRHRFVGRFDRIDGRKIYTSGELYDPEGNVLAEGEGLSITINFEHLQNIAAERRRQVEES
jgi:acyl-coenzyme A thioesterase PaaI-like protein